MNWCGISHVSRDSSKWKYPQAQAIGGAMQAHVCSLHLQPTCSGKTYRPLCCTQLSICILPLPAKCTFTRREVILQPFKGVTRGTRFLAPCLAIVLDISETLHKCSIVPKSQANATNDPKLMHHCKIKVQLPNFYFSYCCSLTTCYSGGSHSKHYDIGYWGIKYWWFAYSVP